MSVDAEIADVMSLHSSNWPFVINVANSIIGVSVLALPFCFKECGLILGMLLLLGSAWLTNVTCHLLVKTALATKRRTYEYLAFHIFGTAGKFTVEVSIIGMLIGTCIAFYIIIGDLGPAILSKLYGIENTPNLRTVLLIAVTLFGALPLGMLRSLDSVSRFSALSLIFYGIFALHVVSSAFANFWSGVWISKVVYWNLDGLFKCLPIIAIAFACQTQLFIVYEALPEPSLKHMDSIVGTAVGLCGVVYALVGCFGYVAFYDHEISGDVLMNFRPTLFSELIKLGFVSSTIMSFPLVIFPCRASIYTLFFTQRQSLHRNLTSATYIPPLHFKLITVCIVMFSLCVGIAIPNVEFMLSITGATMGSLICFILPAVMNMSVTSLGQGKQKYKAQFVLFVGVTILLASTYVTISTQERLVQQESVVKLAQPIEHHDSDAINQAELDRLLNDKGLIEEIQHNSSRAASENSKPDDMKQLDSKGLLVDKKNDMPLEPPVAVLMDGDKRKEPPNPREPLELPKDDVKESIVVKEDDDNHPEVPAVEGLDSQRLVTSNANKQIPVEVIKEVDMNITKDQRTTGGTDVKVGQKLVKKVIVDPVLLDSTPSPNKTLIELMPPKDVAVNTSSLKQEVGYVQQLQQQPQNGDVAKNILIELQKHREEQKRLLSEQRQIVDELRRHDLELHRHHEENIPEGVHDLMRPKQPSIVVVDPKPESMKNISNKTVDRQRQESRDSEMESRTANVTNAVMLPPLDDVGQPRAVEAFRNIQQDAVNPRLLRDIEDYQNVRQGLVNVEPVKAIKRSHSVENSQNIQQHVVNPYPVKNDNSLHLIADSRNVVRSTVDPQPAKGHLAREYPYSGNPVKISDKVH